MPDIVIQTKSGGVAVNGLADDPEITILRADTDAVVVNAAAMTDQAVGGLYKFAFEPAAGLNYSFFVDADPSVTGQVDDRNYFGGFTNEIDYEESAIWVDFDDGAAGSRVGINGTQDNPVDNEADLITLLAATNIKEIRLAGTLTATQAYQGYHFRATEGGGVVNANGQDFAGSIFDQVGITGTFNSTGDMFGTAMSFVGTTNNWRGVAVRPGFSGTITVAPGQIGTFAQAASIVAGTGTPAIGIAGVGTQLNLRAYSGGMRIFGQNNAASNASLEFTAGQVILDNDNTAGTIVVRGIVSPITDNSAGSTVITDAAVQGIRLNDIWQNEGLDPDNPKTITENVPGTDYDELVDSISKSVTKVGAVTTIDRA